MLNARMEDLKPNAWEWQPDRLAGKIVAFCRFARSNGLSGGMQRTLAALEAAKLLGITDRQTLGFALRAVLCSSSEEWQTFEHLYRAFWFSQDDAAHTMASKPVNATSGRARGDSLVLVGLDHGNASSPRSEGKMVSGASSQQRLKTVDFSEAQKTDLADLERLALRLSHQMSARLSRRLKIEDLGNHVDLRRSIRRSISRGGDLISLAFQHRKVQKKKLVIFLDISGSMNLYSLYLVRFAYALHKHFKRVHTFLFSTGVVDVSDVLRARSLADALRKLSQRATEWSSGTRIGGSLRQFNRAHGRRVLTRNTVFVILSDGWDTGAPELLTAELQTTRQRVQKLVWLNPLLGLKKYQPITRGMSAALRYVDVFASAHNLESLLALETYL